MAKSRLHRNERKISQQHDTKVSGVHWIFPTGRKRRAKRLDRPQSGHHGAELANKIEIRQKLKRKRKKPAPKYNLTPLQDLEKRVEFSTAVGTALDDQEITDEETLGTLNEKLKTAYHTAMARRLPPQQRQQSQILAWEDERVFELKRSYRRAKKFRLRRELANQLKHARRLAKSRFYERQAAELN